MLSPTQVTRAYSRSTLLQSILNDSTRRSRIIFQLKKTWSWPKVRFPFGWLKKVRPRLGSQVNILFLALWSICRRFTIFMDFYLVNEKGLKKEKDFLVKVSRCFLPPPLVYFIIIPFLCEKHYNGRHELLPQRDWWQL